MSRSSERANHLTSMTTHIITNPLYEHTGWGQLGHARGGAPVKLTPLTLPGPGCLRSVR